MNKLKATYNSGRRPERGPRRIRSWQRTQQKFIHWSTIAGWGFIFLFSLALILGFIN